MRAGTTVLPLALLGLGMPLAVAQDGSSAPVLDGLVADLQSAPGDWTALSERFSAAWWSGDLLRAVTLLLVLLMIAASCELLFWCYAAPALRALQAVPAAAPRQRALIAVEQFALRLFGVALSTGAAFGVTTMMTWPPVVTATAAIVATALAVLRGAGLLADLLLSPRAASRRVWPWPDSTARRVHAHVMAVAVTACLGYAASRLLGEVMAAPHAAEITIALAGVATGLALLVALSAWSRARRRARPAQGRSLADLLPFAAAAVLVAGMLAWIAGAYQAVWTGLILGALGLADFAAGGILHALLRDRPDADEAESRPDAMSLATAYEPVIRRFARFCLALAAFLAILMVWRVNVLMPASSKGPVAMLIDQSINVLVVVLLCDLAWLWVRTFIDRQLRLAPGMGDGEAASRLSTLLPMIRTAVLIVLVGLTTLVALSAIGVNIAPLLAGAGVVGLAIGFGAQTLVRDIITGVFFLIEDAFRVGEYIDVGARKGTVEAISLRSLRLRHQRGALHTVPFGEIKSLSNESRDWSIVKLEFRIPFDTDLALVKKIIKSINAEIMADPELGPNMLEPLKSQGINRFEEYWMVLRVKYTAKPNAYLFMIRREAYHRIRDAFDKAGIKLGERSVKVEMAGRGAIDDIAAAGGAGDFDDRPAPSAS